MEQFFTKRTPLSFSKLAIFFSFFVSSIVAVGQTQIEVAKSYVSQNFSKQKLVAGDVSEMKTSSAYLSPTTGWYHVYFNQSYQSVEVYNALMSVTLQNNQVQYLTHSFVKDLGTKIMKENLQGVKITPLKAIQNAALSLNLTVGGNIQEVFKNSLNGVDILNQKTYKDSNLSNENIEAKLYWFPSKIMVGEKITGTKMSLVWNVQFLTKNGNNRWNMQVDAFSGQILKTLDDVIHCDFGIPQNADVPHNCSEHNNTLTKNLDNSINMVAPNNYNVFDYPLESPNHGSRSIVASPYNRFAPVGTGPGTTNGWHDDGTIGYTNTKGNNVDAKDDLAADNESSIGSSPNSATLDFNHPYTFGTNTASGNLNAAVTNLFYWNNLIHDVLWRYGFDEPSGNFQKNNMGRGGAGNDFVYADAQDGSGTSNANFQTPTDGGNGRMQMFIWSNGGTPAYTPDSDFDNGIIAHEYGHGWSIRLTGGPANSSCLQNGEQGGEGWSDYAALMFTTNWSALSPNLASANLARGIGTYAIAQPTTGSGIRPYKYSYDMVNVNGPVTYAKVGDFNFSQPHGIGSIWATMLWDMTWAIILQDNQIVNNIYDTPANILDMRGNVAALKLVNEGLRLQPCSPSFIDARDAILRADQMLFGGRYRCAIGRAFARRGLGANASTGTSSDDRVVTEDYTPISGPAITSALSNTICSNENFSYTATTATAGTSFAWTRASVPGISNSSTSGSVANISETLINTTNSPITVTYSFILSPDACGGTASPQPVRVVVNPRVNPSVGTYSVNQNASVPSGQGLAVAQINSNSVNGTLTTSSPNYVRSLGGTTYSADGATYYQTFTFVAPITGSMTFQTTAANLVNCGSDTHISLYQNTFSPTSPATNFLAADDDAGVGLLSLITQNVTQGTTYIIVVGTFCTNDIGTFTLQASSAVFTGSPINWYLNPTGGTSLAIGNIFNPVGVAGSGIANTSTPGTYSFYVSNSDYPTCRTQTSFTIVALQSVGGTVSNANVCSVSNSGVVTLAGNVGTIIRWEISTDNFATKTDEYNFTGNTLPYINLTQTTQYRAIVQYLNFLPEFSSIGTVTVGNVTVAGSVMPETVSVCSGANSGALLLTGHSGNVLNWESSVDNFVTKTTIINTSNILTYTNITTSIKYRAVVKNGTCDASNSATTTISVISATVGGSVSSNVTVCANANAGTLSLSGSVGSVIRWESSVDNFVTKTNIANTTFSQAYSNLPRTFQYRAVLQSGTCAVVNSLPATITVDSVSLGGTVNSNISVCGNTNAGTLNLTGRRGNILRWESSTNNFSTIATIANTTTSQSFLNINQSTNYRAVVKNGVCPASNAAPALVTVIFMPVMNAPTITQPSCFAAGTILVNLGTATIPVEYSINDGINWQTNNLFGGLIGGNYNLKTRTVGGGNCIVSYASNPVSITIPTNGTVGGVVNKDSTVCSGVNTGILNLTGHTGNILRWESSTDNFATVNNITNTTTNYTFNNVATLTKYRAVVKNGACDNANATPATISVLTLFAPSVADASVSNGNSIALIGTNCSANNATLKWFKTADNSSVTMPITPIVNTQYYAKCELTSGNTTCPSANSNSAMVLVIPKDLIYVNTNNTATIQDGATWVTAMNNLQTALSFSENGTSVWVAQGTYKPTTTTNRNVSFNVTSGVKLYGGFAGTETTLQQRGNASETILSGDIGTPNDASDNSYHVMTIVDATVNPTIDKLCVKQGYASNQPLSFTSDLSSKSTLISSFGNNFTFTERGGGIYIKNSSPLITNCKIQNNGATSGGGIYAEMNSIPTIKFSIISGNNATLGGGLYNQNSNTLIDNSLITGNKSFGGAAMYNNRSNPSISNVTIAGNDCVVGNIFNSSSSGNVSNIVIKNSIIWNNTGTLDNLSGITYSIVEGGYSGIGNLNSDPKFVSLQSPSSAPTMAGNYHVLYDSPSVDAGENGSISLTDLDLDGKLRRYDAATVDMGAYELIGNFDTAISGSWDVNATWKCNCIPDGSLPVRIMGNHEITIPNGMTGQAKGLKFVADGKLMPLGTGTINIVR